MPSKSQKQRRWIFYLRGKYKSKENTPKKYKFIWEKSWEEISEEYETTSKYLNIYLEMVKGDFPAVKKFATEQHEGQNRKSGEPYIIHPKKVADKLRSINTPYTTVAAGWLHDVLEDGHTTFDEIQKNFGTKVAKLVKHVTSDKDKISMIGKTEYLKHKMQKLPKQALTLKLADRLDNVSDINDKRVDYAEQTLDILIDLKFDKLTKEQKELVNEIIRTIRSNVKLTSDYNSKIASIHKKTAR